MNDLFIQKILFDWNKIEKDSYLKTIEAFKGMEEMDFRKPVQKIIFFLRMIHTLNYVMQ